MVSGHVMVRMTMASRIASRRADRFVILNTARRVLRGPARKRAADWHRPIMLAFLLSIIALLNRELF